MLSSKRARIKKPPLLKTTMEVMTAATAEPVQNPRRFSKILHQPLESLLIRVLAALSLTLAPATKVQTLALAISLM